MTADPARPEIQQAQGAGRRWLQVAGPALLAVAIGLYALNLALHLHIVLTDVDLAVYRDAGLIARRNPSQLYNWQQSAGVQFTYTPFAAAFCALISMLPWGLVAWALLVSSVAALILTVWLTLGALGWDVVGLEPRASYRALDERIRPGEFAEIDDQDSFEPVQRTLNTGEVDLLLMLLVVADLASRRRRWQGVGVGVAADIKLVPLIFIPYLLITRQYRQAGVAVAAFAATVAAGALLFPRASVTWWLGGAFLNARRTGFVGYLANQSLLGLTTRLAGIVPPTAVWVALVALAGGAGLLLAAAALRRGGPVYGWVVCALTGLVVSPVSWDHHWVWIAPVLAVLADLAARAGGRVRAWAWAAAGLVAVVFAAWPGLWLGSGSAFPWGLIWYAPASRNYLGTRHPEYHWAGLQLLSGNLYLLAGLVLLGAAAVILEVTQPRPPGRLRLVAGRQQPADAVG